MSKGRILSGMKPTGVLHLGNYEGALRNWVRLQDEYEAYFCVVDWHALTTLFEDTQQVRENIRQVAIDFVAAGLDPEKCAIFVQSDVKEHAELHLLLSMITPVPWLERVPTYKETQEQLRIESASYGLLGYPVLQAADILVYKANAVPVGRDQLPHLELTREICRRFNHIYGDIFPEPEAALTECPVLPGLDGRKMSKSYDNAIYLSDSSETITKKVRGMFTDPLKLYKNDPGHPETCPVFAFHQVYSKGETKQIASDCRAGMLGCVACKGRLAETLNAALAPVQERRRQLEADPSRIDRILADGAERARAVASSTMVEVRRVMGIGSTSMECGGLTPLC
ncbi:MAG: tryptophan--tRNA ligase [Armatimonadota bacterium]|nr:tryptophan--tRNA ligase [Armatimonadota bacterium]